MPRNSRRRGGGATGVTRRRRSSDPSSSDRTVAPKRRRTSAMSDNNGRRLFLSDEEFLERMAALRVTLKKREASQLKPEKVDFHIEENHNAHRTSDYASESLIVRRGQEFKLTVNFDRAFDADKDQIILQLTFGNRPQKSKHSLVRVMATNHLSTSSWCMRIDSTNGKSVSLSLMSPANAFVGEYSVFVETKTKKSGTDSEYLTFRKKLSETIMVLFNAWCKDDAVYMDKEKERQEYVLEDHGRIWVGSKRSFTGIPWYFGQFEDVSLSVCLKLLDMSPLGEIARGNATHVCRAISQMANYNDADGGVLEGRWTETYPIDSTEPTEWTGSVAILKQFSKKLKVVRYGQCWVFSGLVTTLLRAIGIPTRSVTNFESAHDTDSSMTIDFHFDKDGEPKEELNDSVWNFHVWNESFLARPDLPPGYGGWQAHDATPQESSAGLMRCGPCPVKAIKEGNVYIPYDGGFIFGEVNGDRVYWEVDDDGDMEMVHIEKTSIGKFISTKAVGSKDREDLTKHYKHPEGSAEERKAVRQANNFSSRRDENIYKKKTVQDVTFEPIIPDDLSFGDDVNIKLLIKNKANDERTVNVDLVTKMAFYTGVIAKSLKNLHEEVTLKAKNEKIISLLITAKDYLGKTTADASIRVFFKAKVQETQQVFNGIDTVEFKKPDIMYSMPKNVSRGENFEMKLSVKNHLPVKLTNCVFNIETSRYLSPDTMVVRVKNPVKPEEEANATISLKAKYGGKRSVDVSFKSDQLSGVRGEIEFVVSR